MGEFNIVKVDAELSKAGKALVEKVSEAFGMVYEPIHIWSKAKAQAKADLIEAKSQIKVDELQRRAVLRISAEETRNQENIESVLHKAVQQLRDDAKSEKMENDWLAHFLEKCKLISDEKMQELWSALLAGEANTPGKYAKRTLDILSSMSRKDAETFQSLCSFCWNIDGPIVVVFDHNDKINKEHGVDFDILTQLEALGLVKFTPNAGFVVHFETATCEVSYVGTRLTISLSESSDNSLQTGTVLLTQSGEELVSVCKANPVEGFVDYVRDFWISGGHEVTVSTEMAVRAD